MKRQKMRFEIQNNSHQEMDNTILLQSKIKSLYQFLNPKREI